MTRNTEALLKDFLRETVMTRDEEALFKNLWETVNDKR